MAASRDEGSKRENGSRFAAIAGTSKNFREICLLEPGKKPRPLTQLNPQTATWKLPTVSQVSWKGVGGDTVYGVLEMPAGAKANEPLPFVVALHGGPTTAAYCQMDSDMYLGRLFLSRERVRRVMPQLPGLDREQRHVPDRSPRQGKRHRGLRHP